MSCLVAAGALNVCRQGTVFCARCLSDDAAATYDVGLRYAEGEGPKRSSLPAAAPTCASSPSSPRPSPCTSACATSACPPRPWHAIPPLAGGPHRRADSAARGVSERFRHGPRDRLPSGGAEVGYRCAAGADCGFRSAWRIKLPLATVGRPPSRNFEPHIGPSPDSVIARLDECGVGAAPPMFLEFPSVTDCIGHMHQSSQVPSVVAVGELEARLSEYLRLVKGGRELVVTERGQAIARITARAPRTCSELLRERPCVRPTGSYLRLVQIAATPQRASLPPNSAGNSDARL
jgi:antitoxin (DNA-binding transcriptional repressor) of toxin-antitoxin stability system